MKTACAVCRLSKKSVMAEVKRADVGIRPYKCRFFHSKM